jgi:adenylate cyclase
VGTGGVEGGIGVVELQAAGLYDPDDPGAEGRLALLEYLVERGATLEMLVYAAAMGRLRVVASELARKAGVRIDATELAERTGLTVDQIERVWRAGGLPELDVDAAVFNDDDVAGFATFAAGVEMFGEGPTLQFVRVVGASMASIADAAMAMFGINVQSRFEGADPDELHHARVMELASVALRDQVPLTVVSFLSHHVNAASRRTAISSAGRMSTSTLDLVVGFLDLVGSTALANQLSAQELGVVITDFERVTTDAVTRRGGRVVKHIGDEVMFVVADAGDACDIALELCEHFGPRTETPMLRGALASGPLVRGYGDYYGPYVNLASRMVKEAEPGAVVVTDEVRHDVSGRPDLVFDALGPKRLRGFDDPVPMFSLART